MKRAGVYSGVYWVFIVILIIPLFIYFVTQIGFKPAMRTLSTNANIVKIRSDYDGYTIAKTRSFNDIYAYLDHIGFWREQAVFDYATKSRVMAKKNSCRIDRRITAGLASYCDGQRRFAFSNGNITVGCLGRKNESLVTDVCLFWTDG